MKTAISIPDDVFDSAEELAKELGVSRSHLYATAVARFVDSHRKDRIREALDEVYAEESSELDPVLAQVQLASIEREDW